MSTSRAMRQAEFESLVARMELLATERPAYYRRRTFALAALGYAYLFVVLLVLAALTFASLAAIAYAKALAFKLVLLFGALLWVVLRALWIRLEPPTGRVVTAEEAPALFDMLTRLIGQLDTPAVHRVLVTDDFNAAIVQTPRIGPFGPHQNTLLLGLPLMKALTPEQFEAVLAHELGHLSRGHGRSGNWIYRLRLMWQRLERALDDQPRWAAQAIQGFFHWYIPYFQACSFPLARRNEYEADATSMRLTSPRSAAQALTNVSVVGRFLHEQYWPEIHRGAAEQPAPKYSPYAAFHGANIGPIDGERVRTWMRAALEERTTLADTHPALKDRLQAIGMPAELAVPAPGEAADQLLGPLAVSLEAELDSAWREAVRGSWRKAYEETQTSRARLTALRQQSLDDPLEEGELLELASLEEHYENDPAAALQRRRQAHTRFPESVLARFALGCQLLRQGEAEGVELVEWAVAQEPDAIEAGAQALRDYFHQQGDMAAARAWHNRYLDRREILERREAQQTTVRLDDAFLRHDLAPEAVDRLADELRCIPRLRRAYLARRYSREPSDPTIYVLGFKVTAMWQLYREQHVIAAMAAIQHGVALPEGTLIINVDGPNYRFGRKFFWMRGTRIV